MKIWFDISNSPQVLLFKDMLLDLKRQGHDIVVTSRPLANTAALLDKEQIKHTLIGKHYGKKTLFKILGYPIRVYHLWAFLRSQSIELSVSQSSFHAPLVAKLLGIQSIYTNDNEYAVGNIPAFLFASKVMLPEKFKIDNSILHAFIKQKIIYYPGVKEGMYLFRKAKIQPCTTISNPENKFKIYIRPEPSTAQYYNGKENFLDELIQKLKSAYAVTILPRNEIQRAHYSSPAFKSVTIPSSILSFDDILKDCCMFIGAGGSMTREMALMGVPTISVYQDKLLSVDLELIKTGHLLYKPDLTINDVRNMSLASSGIESEFMDKGKLAYNLFLTVINNYNK